MRKKLIIIQARTGSTRLPGKILLMIQGKEIILHLLDRLIPSKYTDHIIVATPMEKSDDGLASLCINYHPKVSVCRGSEKDVLDRFYQAAKTYNNKSGEQHDIVRITSDCPLLHFNVVDDHLRAFDTHRVDYLSSRIKKRTKSIR